MSAQSYSNLANSEFNGNIVLTNPSSYIQFGNGSKQSIAGGGSGGNVSTDQDNTFEDGYTQTFQGAISIDNTQSNIGQFQNANTAIGISLSLLTTGADNTCLGYNAGSSITTSSFNTAVGFSALLDVTGSNNTACGYNAGVNDETGSNNTYLGSEAQQQDLDTSSYNYLTLIGADSEPVEVGSDNQIVLGRLNGDDNLYIPGNNIFLGKQNNINEAYTIQASGNNSGIQFQTLPSTGLPYENTLTLSTSLSELTSGQISLNGDVTITGDVTIPSPNNLYTNDTQYVAQAGDPGYVTNAVIYFNNTVPVGQQLRVSINGTLYYINLTAV
jgi:hypothetical protein